MTKRGKSNCPHLNPLPEGEEVAKRQVRVFGIQSCFPAFLIHFFFRWWTTSLFPSGSRNCAIQQIGVSDLSISNVTLRSFNLLIASSMFSTSNATVVPSREGFQAG